MSIQHLQDGYSYLFQQTKATPYGIPNDPYDSIKTDPRLDANNGISTVTLDAALRRRQPPYSARLPRTVCLTGPCSQRMVAFNETIDPALKTPYNIIFNAGVQRSLPWRHGSQGQLRRPPGTPAAGAGRRQPGSRLRGPRVWAEALSRPSSTITQRSGRDSDPTNLHHAAVVGKCR